ncbi:flagellin N-terminal helical domain-containing protein [Metabacillus indicus]|uniref:Flagellin n=1 Tax=Metabacillus indicus TaxID=246786 RepID=A0A084GJL9_METID|nr:flagellin [Metabacillus indicus]KEZ47531.1 hypothetical protein GS18_0219260 [Metabacillus indicus]
MLGVLYIIINHNISALNTLSKLNKNNKNAATAIEKISSGLRINKASDDSAGLAISEKMRAQIRGLEQAQRNIQDGISLIQIAESGLSTIQDPNLLRLRELAIQASNDTLTNEDRQQIQKEVVQINKGINEIANNTEFNGIKLLNRAVEEVTDVIGVDTTFNWQNVNGTNGSSRQALATNGEVIVSNLSRVPGDPAIFEYSYDGINWSQANSSDVVEDFRDITWDGDQFLAVGVRSIATSADGIVWTTKHSYESTRVLYQDLNAIAGNKDIIVAVGSTRDVSDPNGDPFSIPSNGHALYSTDGGYSWSASDVIPRVNGGDYTNLKDIVYGNGKFVAVGGTLSSSFSISNPAVVSTSSDGINWVIHNLYDSLGLEGNLTQVYYDNNQFIAVGDGGMILKSSDGENWIKQNSQTTNNLYGITKANGYFITTGANVKLASKDLINWEIVDANGAGEIVSIGKDFLALGSDYTFGEIINNDITVGVVAYPNLNLQVGANSNDGFQVKLTDGRTTALGIDDIDLSTRLGAETAILKIDKAMDTVSSERSKFGAYQNALEHVHNNVSNYEMNLTASESSIRDTNMPKQLMEMTKSQILTQASQAMLSHANQQPEQVLQLLK